MATLPPAPQPTPEQMSVKEGHLVRGEFPTSLSNRRWVTVADVPNRDLPDVPAYECRKTSTPVVVDGRLDEQAWADVEWSQPFGHIADGDLTGHETRIALRWDDHYLYAAYRVEDPDVRAHTVRHHEHVYQLDDDVEIFVELDGGYYELGVNPINTIYELRWTWVDRLIEDEDWAALEDLFKTPDYLYYTRRSSERLGRVGNLEFDLEGLQRAVYVDGAINQPNVRDKGWTVEFALPWKSLASISRSPHLLPPKPGDTLRIQAYRAQHDWHDVEGARRLQEHRPGATPYEGYTWSAMGNGNVHNPERWVTVTFTDEAS